MKYLTKSLNVRSSDFVRIEESTYSIVSNSVDSADIPLYEVSSASGKRQQWKYAFFGVVCEAMLMRIYTHSKDRDA